LVAWRATRSDRRHNPAGKGAFLFVDSADKVARFVWSAMRSRALVFLGRRPGFMIGSKVEREASSATAPR
jgi:acetyl-CoA carboxylase carboxyltransferase component